MPAGSSIIRHALDNGIWTAHRDGIPITSNALKIGPHSIDVSLGGKFIKAVRKDIPWAPDRPLYLSDFDTPLLDPYLEEQPKIEWKTIEADYYDLMPQSFVLSYVRERFDSSKPVPTRFGRWYDDHSGHDTLGDERRFTQMYDGRSTMGRLGIMSHITAGYGDLGFASNFTLEIFNVNPNIAVRLHRGMRIGQICFDDVHNIDSNPKMYDGSYIHQHDTPVAPALGWRRFVQPGESLEGYVPK
jgi:deoxycytidine triphosphate deaminase